jgi:hypothetical protein
VLCDDEDVSAVPPSAPVRIVSPALRRGAVVLWVVAVVLVPLGLVTGGPGTAVFVPVPSVFTALVAWVVLWRPHVALTDDALVVVDVRRTTTYAWRRVTDVRTRYGLDVLSSEGTRRVWIAPRATARLRVVGAGGPGVAERSGGPSSVDLDVAADVIRARIPVDAPTGAAPPATVTAAPIVHRAHGWAVTALVVLGIAASMAGARL